MSRPESVSSKIDSFGANIDICKISFFFFSPPENPTFNCLLSFLNLAKKKASELGIDENFLARQLNVGFSGGEKKKNEILQMKLLEPRLIVLDETDSGLDIDALKIVAQGVNTSKTKKNAFLIITHYQKILDYIEPDFVHVLSNGKITKTGNKELGVELEKTGYTNLK